MILFFIFFGINSNVIISVVPTELLLFVLLFLQTFRSYWNFFYFQIFKLADFQIKLLLQYDNSYDLYFV